MFAKLFSRITESSLMEEDIVVRYTFVMMLAISDPEGNVIGTDVAIARRLNMPLALFAKCIEKLRQPDEDSNSKEHDGRRVLPSEGERGYKLVNYLVYRDMKSNEGRREYMREYMRKHRAGKHVNANNANSKQGLADEEGEGDATEESFFGGGLEPEKENKKRGTLDDLQNYAIELGLPATDGEHLFNNWEANGWRTKTGPIKDWKAAFRTWKSGGWLPSQNPRKINGQNTRSAPASAANAGTSNATRARDYR